MAAVLRRQSRGRGRARARRNPGAGPAAGAGAGAWPQHHQHHQLAQHHQYHPHAQHQPQQHAWPQQHHQPPHHGPRSQHGYAPALAHGVPSSAPGAPIAHARGPAASAGPISIARNPSIAGVAPRSQPLTPAPAPSLYAAAAAPTVPTATAAAPSKQWPPPLKAYVERCFAVCKLNESLRDFVTEELKRIINDATARGELWTKDWDRCPLPRPPPPASTRPAGGWDGAAGYARYPEGELSGDEDDAAAPPSRANTKGKLKGKGKGKDTGKGRDAFGKGQGSGKRLRSGASEEDADGWAEGVASVADGLTPAERAKRAKRSGRFGDGAAEGAGPAAAAAAAARRERLASMRFTVAAAADRSDAAREETWDALTIRGTCERVEKSYFRLTSAPDPATVRPERVLRVALDRLREGPVKDESYHYLADQLKAIRQDLTVQRVRSAFTAEVYEHHARVALRHGDLGEFNQCQTVLRALYDEGVVGRETEFVAYEVLYVAATGTKGAAANAALTRAWRRRTDPAVAHALAARAALAEDNAVDWFRLLGAAPGMGRELMDVKSDEVRFKYLEMVARVIRPAAPVARLARTLGFAVPAKEECREGADSTSKGADVSTSEGADGAPRVMPGEADATATAACEAWLTRTARCWWTTERGDAPSTGKRPRRSSSCPRTSTPWRTEIRRWTSKISSTRPWGERGEAAGAPEATRH